MAIGAGGTMSVGLSLVGSAKQRDGARRPQRVRQAQNKRANNGRLLSLFFEVTPPKNSLFHCLGNFVVIA